MKLLLLLLIPLFAFAQFERIQNEDVKSEATLLLQGGSVSQLINDTKIYVTGSSINKRLDQAIADGDIGAASPLTTKGDLFTFDTADARLPVGTDGQILIANSTTATGLEWIDSIFQNTEELVKVEGVGNDARAIAANVTPISFNESIDNLNTWNVDTFTVPVGIANNTPFTFCGSVRFTANIGANLFPYIDRGSGFIQGVILTDNTGGNSQYNFCFTEFLKAGDQLQIRSNTAGTLNNNNILHKIAITQSPDIEGVIASNPRAFRTDQYSETEIEWGEWNTEQLYRRCFTVSSQVTGSGTFTTWDAGLNPKGLIKFDAANWAISSVTDGTVRAFVLYSDSTGEVNYATTGGYFIDAGSSFCMDYTK